MKIMLFENDENKQNRELIISYLFNKHAIIIMINLEEVEFYRYICKY